MILASASERRHRLLREAGLSFEIEPADVDETLEGHPEPRHAACLLAERKARLVALRHRGQARLVIGADTIVALSDPRGGATDATGATAWRLLGKPQDEGEARAMLTSLSATRHQVVTGVSVFDARDGLCLTDCERTWVTMRRISPQEVGDYVASGEWRGKAGGYAIQENADAFVERLQGGGFDNVVGLPVALTLRLLQNIRRRGEPGALAPPPTWG